MAGARKIPNLAENSPMRVPMDAISRFRDSAMATRMCVVGDVDYSGECEVTPACYGRLTRQLIESFPEGSAPRVALVLEGGYNLDSIAASAEECM